MHKNGVWLFLVALATAVSLWFTWGAVKELVSFLSHNRAAVAHVAEWKVEQLAGDAYGIRASYNYQVDGNSYHASTRFKSQKYRNPWAAEQAISKMKERSWSAWYSGRNPGDSTLEKELPVKKLVSAALLLLLTLYFYWLGLYTSSRQQR